MVQWISAFAPLFLSCHSLFLVTNEFGNEVLRGLGDGGESLGVELPEASRDVDVRLRVVLTQKRRHPREAATRMEICQPATPSCRQVYVQNVSDDSDAPNVRGEGDWLVVDDLW